MSDPVTRYGLPHVTVPRESIEECPPSVIERVAAHVRRMADAWYALPQAERDRIVGERLAAREVERDEWLRSWVADERARGLQYVDTLLDTMARSVGLDPYDAWRRPRADERAERLAETTATIRRDLVAAGHKPATTGLESPRNYREQRALLEDSLASIPPYERTLR